jgi:hypothetical protein
VAEVWGSAHGTVTPLSLTSDLTAMKAELEEAKKERDNWFREAEERADACSHLVKERDELREALNLAAINRATEPSNGGTA